MLKKSITYTDYNGREVTEDFYFHLSKADLVEMELSSKGGLAAKLQAIVESKDGAAIVAEFKKIILGSYGQKSEDGRRFIRSQELRDSFQETEAYSVLFFELCTNADAAAEFVNGIVPQGIEKDVAKLQAQHPSDTAAKTAEPNLGTSRNIFEMGEPTKVRTLTSEEVREMDADELKSGLATGRYKLQ